MNIENRLRRLCKLAVMVKDLERVGDQERIRNSQYAKECQRRLLRDAQDKFDSEFSATVDAIHKGEEE